MLTFSTPSTISNAKITFLILIEMISQSPASYNTEISQKKHSLSEFGCQRKLFISMHIRTVQNKEAFSRRVEFAFDCLFEKTWNEKTRIG